MNGFEAWLREKLSKERAYDKIVRELLTAPMTPRPAIPGPCPRKARAADATNPLAFYLAKEAKPENLAAASVAAFLGVKLECAQCHDHPIASGPANSSGASRRSSPASSAAAAASCREDFDRRELAIPSTAPHGAGHLSRRQGAGVALQAERRANVYADWVMAKDNPYFARAAVNRLWGYFFGIGSGRSRGRLRRQEPAEPPGLLDELGRAFVGVGTSIFSDAPSCHRAQRRVPAVERADLRGDVRDVRPRPGAGA